MERKPGSPTGIPTTEPLNIQYTTEISNIILHNVTILNITLLICRDNRDDDFEPSCFIYSNFFLSFYFTLWFSGCSIFSLFVEKRNSQPVSLPVYCLAFLSAMLCVYIVILSAFRWWNCMNYGVIFLLLRILVSYQFPANK